MLAPYFLLKSKRVSNILYVNTPRILRANSSMKIDSFSFSNSGHRGCFVDLFSSLSQGTLRYKKKNTFKRIFLRCINHGNWFSRLRPRSVLNKNTEVEINLFSTLPERQSSSDFELLHAREEILSNLWYNLFIYLIKYVTNLSMLK